MALAQNMIASSTSLDHEIQIHNTQFNYTSLLLTTSCDVWNTRLYFSIAISNCIDYLIGKAISDFKTVNSKAGYDSACCFTPALSCIVPAEAQPYILPYTLPPTSYIVNSSRQCESMKKREISPCKLIATTPPHAASSKNKLGRPYNPGRPLAMEERQKILQLYEKGYRISHIARIIGVTHSCVSKIMTRYRRTGSMQPRSTCSTTKKNIDYNSDMNIDSVSNNNYQKLCRSYTVDATLSDTSRPVKSYLIQSILCER